MNPQVPSSTYPNHMTLVTGVYPEVHGIISNIFYDENLNRTFAYRNAKEAHLPHWWLAEPIWNTVQKSGKRSGVCFWPGSEAEILGLRPNFYKPFTSRMKMEERFHQLLTWMDLPETERPSLFVSYYEKVDQIGHKDGTSSVELDEAIREYDDAFGVFLEALKRRGILQDLNIVVLSDHGMQDIQHIIRLDEEGLLDESEFSFFDYSPFTYLTPKDPSRRDSIVKSLRQGAKGRYRVFLKDELPPYWHFNYPSRLSDILIVCEPGYIIIPSFFETIPKGAHAYYVNDEDGKLVNESMQALFMFSSARVVDAVKQQKHSTLQSISLPYPRLYNVNVPSFENLEVYSFLCDLLQVPAAPNNGTQFLTNTFLSPSS